MTNLEQKEPNKEEEISQNEAAELTNQTTSEPQEEEILEAESTEEESIVAESEEIVEEAQEEEATIEDVVEEKVEVDSTSEDVEEESITDIETTETSDSVEESDAEVVSEETNEENYYQALLEKAREFVTQDDWAFVSNELANLALHITEGPEPDGDEAVSAIGEFNKLREEFDEKKRAHYEELNKRKEENLAAKKELLKQFADLIEEKKWSDTKTVNYVKGKWEHIKLLPAGENEILNERFEALLQEFENHKVDRLVKKLQLEEENLTLKLVILEKMDALNQKSDSSDVNFEELNHEFHDLLIQWRKIGRVPVEKNQQVWDHFNSAQDKFGELRFKHDKKYRLSIEKALEKKKRLIEEAESLIDDNSIADAARRVNKLHKAWKKTGNLPQKEENELWDKFKAATDAFNDKKSENIEVLREQEQKNYTAKLALIQRAIEVQKIENYDEGHSAMQKLMDEWKLIGPVPRKKSSKVWKQFKDAMDAFYNLRREHFKSIRKDQKDNLTLKKELLDRLKELVDSDDPSQAVQKTKEIQAEFKKIGHVPLKFKNKIWKEYRELCDIIYGNFRSMGADSGMDRRLASEGIEPEARKEIIKLQKELENLRKEVAKLETEVIQFEEAKTYFKPTNKGNVLRDELQSKVDKAEQKIARDKKRISELVQQINKLKTTNEDTSDSEE